jgi:biotin carboxylase
LRRCRIEGVATTLDLHRRLVEDDEMCAGGVDTMFFTRFLARQETLSDATVGA